MYNSPMLKPVLIGGVVTGVLSALPYVQWLNFFCCAWVILGGILTSYLYVSNAPTTVTLTRGLALGLFSGMVGTLIYLIYSALFLFIAIHDTQFLQGMMEIMERIFQMRPDAREALQSTIANPGYLIPLFLLLSILVAVVFGVTGMLGGVIGVAIFERRKPADEATLSSKYFPPQEPPSSPADSTGGNDAL